MCIRDRNQGAASFIFDVRDNIGENLNAALVCADYCVPSGVIAQQEDKDGSITLLRMSDENEVTVPMVVLVNGSTSDGAELFANALRKMNSATIVEMCIRDRHLRELRLRAGDRAAQQVRCRGPRHHAHRLHPR